MHILSLLLVVLCCVVLCCVVLCCVGSGFCDRLTTLAEEFYRVCVYVCVCVCVSMCRLETLTTKRPRPDLGVGPQK